MQFNDYILQLDAAQVAAMTGELDDVIRKWWHRTNPDPAPGARQVLLYVYPVPTPRSEES